MIWVKAAALLIFGAILLAAFAALSCAFEDFCQGKFGKPPRWIGIIAAAIWTFVLLLAIKRSLE